MTDSELIDHLGGPAKVAGLLGWKAPGQRARVQNWKTRGIPSKVKVTFPEIFMSKRAKPKPKAKTA